MAEHEHNINSIKVREASVTDTKDGDSSFKFNAQAPEFVPRSHSQVPVHGYYYPCVQLGSPDWFYVGDQEHMHLLPSPSDSPTNSLNDDLRLKIVKQVEYQLSDMSLVANETLLKQINKDSEGYIPVSVLASSKKMKSLVSDHQLLANALHSSTKLVVSEDGKKVKRKFPFTEKEKEDMQSRTVVVENLPEDHSHQSIEKVFGTVGSVRTVRIWHPQEQSSSRPKMDSFVSSSKVHALVEFEAAEAAELAVERLNDERNWRKGLRVRPLLRRTPKSVLKNRRPDFDGSMEEDEASEESPRLDRSPDRASETNGEEGPTASGSKKGWGRGRGKLRARMVGPTTRGLIASPTSVSGSSTPEASPKHTPRGPRMPDGTRGFTMGRGRPVPAGSPTA